MVFRHPLFITVASLSLLAADPDYTAWNKVLSTHYDPTKGMDYAGLAKQDWSAMKRAVADAAKVEPAALNAKERQAYYMNLYNITVVNLMMENRQTKSIRDLSTDPVIRINIFKKDLVETRSGKMALKSLEDDLIRKGFKDPRIHFAINCAARSCPPLRMEAYVGSRLDAQLDEQVRAFFSGPNGLRFEPTGDKLVIHGTKILDWFSKDFDDYAGGQITFIRKFVKTDPQKQLDQFAGRVKLTFDKYDWSSNIWNR